VGTSKKQPQGDSQRVLQCNIAQGAMVPHDGLAKMPVRLNAGGHKGVTRVQMARMRLVLVPAMQSGSSASRLGSGGNVGRQRGWNMETSSKVGPWGRGGSLQCRPAPPGLS
jgi:hypothetical protein